MQKDLTSDTGPAASPGSGYTRELQHPLLVN